MELVAWDRLEGWTEVWSLAAVVAMLIGALIGYGTDRISTALARVCR